jgi:hypothetical protein
MTEEQVKHLIVSVLLNLERFIPREFQKTIRQTKEMRWAISDIIRSAEFYITGEHSDKLHAYDDIIKSELDRISH